MNRELGELVKISYAFAKALEDLCVALCEEEPAVPEKETTKPIALEEVRKVLAGLSQKGFTAAVKTIIGEFGAERLSEIPAERYADVLKRAEEIENG